MENTPTFNLKAVIRETGLTPATLRAWERRYGLIKPQRSAGGHRLYTQNEIDILKWLVARQADGLSISHAVALWRSQEIMPVDSTPMALTTGNVPASRLDTLEQLCRSWVKGCLDFNESAADWSLSQALAMASPEVVCTEILQKGLAELGDGWYSGRVSIHQEHFASGLAVRRLNALFAAAPAPTRPYRILAACPPGETHDLALLMAAIILRWKGLDLVYLGANVPLERLDSTLHSTTPHLVVSVTQTLPGAASLGEMASYLLAEKTLLAFGGGIFDDIPGLADRIPGFFLGHELGAVPTNIDILLNRAPELPQPVPLDPAHAAALWQFKQKEALIVTSVNSKLQKSRISLTHIEEANNNFGRSIAAALALGNIHFLDHSITWLSGLLNNYGLSPDLAAEYYNTYRTAVQEHLGKKADLLLDWLETANTT
jgi:MerR family transcriptional regulator, light-induced transcriptional regulator